MHDSADMQVLQAQEALAKQANPPKLGFDNALVVSPLDESLEVSTCVELIDNIEVVGIFKDVSSLRYVVMFGNKHHLILILEIAYRRVRGRSLRKALHAILLAIAASFPHVGERALTNTVLQDDMTRTLECAFPNLNVIDGVTHAPEIFSHRELDKLVTLVLRQTATAIQVKALELVVSIPKEFIRQLQGLCNRGAKFFEVKFVQVLTPSDVMVCSVHLTLQPGPLLQQLPNARQLVPSAPACGREATFILR
mmetsp:Transcript_32269/g.73785  ORF Transcript_32269/g.73785 Transcript_32269/m.73785 type:complete len:252 (-) Transcript_32269:483-1238(-)